MLSEESRVNRDFAKTARNRFDAATTPKSSAKLFATLRCIGMRSQANLRRYRDVQRALARMGIASARDHLESSLPLSSRVVQIRNLPGCLKERIPEVACCKQGRASSKLVKCAGEGQKRTVKLVSEAVCRLGLDGTTASVCFPGLGQGAHFLCFQPMLMCICSRAGASRSSFNMLLGGNLLRVATQTAVQVNRHGRL
jgi:hypothetical protein